MEENFSMEWIMEENFSLEWNMEWKIFGMEWKKIAIMKYGKIVFHSIPYHALMANLNPTAKVLGPVPFSDYRLFENMLVVGILSNSASLNTIKIKTQHIF